MASRSGRQREIGRLRYNSVLSLSRLVSLLPFLISVSHARTEFPLDQFPIYTQAGSSVGPCVAYQSEAFSTSYGCPTGTPGPCLCTDALKSSKIGEAISSCVSYQEYDQQTSAAQLWQEYCKTNGGVSIIHSETALQNIPLYTQITLGAASCLAHKTASYSITFGCSDYTHAPCLCGVEASSDKIWAAVSSCMTYESTDQVSSASMLLSSFCNINLVTPASRVIGAPITVSGKKRPRWYYMLGKLITLQQRPRRPPTSTVIP